MAAPLPYRYAQSPSSASESEDWQARNRERNSSYDATAAGMKQGVTPPPNGTGQASGDLRQRAGELMSLPAGARPRGMENVDMALLPTTGQIQKRQQMEALRYAGARPGGMTTSSFFMPGGNPNDPSGANTGPTSANYGVMRRSGINPATGKPYDHIAVDAKGQALKGFSGFEDAVQASQNSRAEVGMSVPYAGAPDTNRSFDRTPAGRIAAPVTPQANASPDMASQAWAQNSAGRFNYQAQQQPQDISAAPLPAPTPTVPAAPQSTPSVAQNFGERGFPSQASADAAAMRAGTLKRPAAPEAATTKWARGLYEGSVFDVTSKPQISSRQIRQGARPSMNPNLDAGSVPMPMRPMDEFTSPFTSPTQQLKTQMKQGKASQVAANVFTRPRNLSMRNGYMPA